MNDLELTIRRAALGLPCPYCKVRVGLSCLVVRGQHRGEVAPIHGQRMTAAVAKGLGEPGTDQETGR